jgi:hypothetical protein
MSTSDYEFEFKLRRAQRHLDDLCGEISAWLDGNSHTMTHERDDQRTDYYSAYVEMDPCPVIISLLVGDILHNARSTLDHLAYALAARHSGIPLPNDITQQSEFPIFNMPPKGNALTKRIRGICPEAQTIIEELQPYQRQQGATILSILHELSNIDKHRLLLSAAFVNIDGVINYKECVNCSPEKIQIHSGYLAGKTKVATYKASPHDPSRKVYVEFVALMDVVFRCGSTVDGVSVGTIVTGIVQRVMNIIACLKPYL